MVENLCQGGVGLNWLKVIIIPLAFFVIMNIKVVEGIEVNGGATRDHPVNQSDIYEIVRGAVEDSGWMSCRSKNEVRQFLGRYFEGVLLDDLTERTWEFIREPTDWYSVYKVADLKIMCSDGKRALAEALIRIEDVNTGHNDFGKGLFAMTHGSGGWRINYVCFNWGRQAEER